MENIESVQDFGDAKNDGEVNQNSTSGKHLTVYLHSLHSKHFSLTMTHEKYNKYLWKPSQSRRPSTLEAKTSSVKIFVTFCRRTFYR